ncbi:heat shock 70 kDa protein 12B-like [Mercenaria mercenaria]|uniref:heat shock 70 kDa protein 12B-like n=1 Tax=Mercenaria mercenaria TaxID=6596 RepID=UPI00234FACB3|nr:heat shock 70 kDa protein 12B-like [Mercenaria mercenaria]
MSDVFISAAIDFGTTFSSWAFSFKHTFKQEPTRVTARRWKSPGNSISQKAPTSLLIMPDGETIDSFGYEAERKYATLSEEDTHTEWYFFQRFKMQLYSKTIDRRLKLKDVSGKQLLAKTVFALSIKFLKDDLISTVNKGLIKKESTCEVKEKDEANSVEEGAQAERSSAVEGHDIRWVLTVPAIWDDAAKQFMREAAEEAGIPKDNLYIGLEPEAASIFCRFLPVMDRKGSMSDLQPGSKYMILDAGGGTVDITVHEVGDEGKLKEKHKASGGNWGGTKVDQEYHTFLQKIFGKAILKKMERCHMEDCLQMKCDFEVKKRLSEADLGQKVTVRIPASFQELLQNESGLTLKQSIERSCYKKNIVVSGDKMRIDFELFRGFFDISVKETTKHVSTILKHPDVSDCKTILMVGGFSDSIILQDEMLKAFPDISIVIPPEPELSIIKGAVIFGHDPSVIAERKLKFTYGTVVIHKKGGSECNHRRGKRKNIMGVLCCIDIFDVHVRIGQIVRLGEEQAEREYMPIHPLADETNVQIFSSTKENPTFVTDESCKRIGTLKVSLTPDLLGALIGFRTGGSFTVSFIFGGTEIKVKAKDTASGKEADVILDCLDDM